MDQIVVPQFLDVEDKIIGPITVRQFIELLIGGMLIVLFYRIFDFSLFIVSGLIVFGLDVIIAFAKIGGQSFHYFALNFVQTLRNPKLKVWKKSISIDEIKQALKEPSEIKLLKRQPIRPMVTSSRLSELSLIVDTGGVYQGEDGMQ